MFRYTKEIEEKIATPSERHKIEDNHSFFELGWASKKIDDYNWNKNAKVAKFDLLFKKAYRGCEDDEYHNDYKFINFLKTPFDSDIKKKLENIQTNYLGCIRKVSKSIFFALFSRQKFEN